MIKSIAVQGNPTADQFVTSFALESSVVAESWVPYVETGARRIFQGNSDGGRIMKHSLLHVVTASRMRVRPITWYGHVCLRVELYGCDADPLVPLGMNSGEIPSWAITASSSWYPSGYTGPELHPANYGRLYSSIANTDTCWASSEVDTAPFFQVNLGRLRYVTAIATQRRYGVSQRVTAYNVKYGDCVTWKTIEEDSGQAKVFPGNTLDNEDVVRNVLPQVVLARCVRICPTAWDQHCSLRAELYSYGMATASDLVVRNTYAVYSASSRHDFNHEPDYAKFSSYKGARTWCPLTVHGNHWLQICLGHVTLVTGVVTQRHATYATWVTSFQVAHSLDGVNFQYYNEEPGGAIKTFTCGSQVTTACKTFFMSSIKAKCIRLHILAWNNQADGYHLCMRAQLIGHIKGTVGAPVFSDIASDVTVYQHEDVTLSCNSAGDLPITTSWSRGDQVLQTSTSQPNLALSNVTSLQTGHYKCTVTNARGSNSRIVHLLVKEPLSMCSNYVTLADDSRLFSRVTATLQTDDVSLNESNWYLLTGQTGYYRLPVRAVPEGRCGATSSGWMNGGHPSVQDGVVKRTVCFHSNAQMCRYSVTILVRNCFGYHVYRFKKLDASWNARYCAENFNEDGVDQPEVRLFSSLPLDFADNQGDGHVTHREYHVTSNFVCMQYCMLHPGCRTFKYVDSLMTCKLSNSTTADQTILNHAVVFHGQTGT
ncbi:uncharacterized protein LOC5508875 isoform X2 [Nematostella vectensis]|nr:uncharacterized protein LOC5508875 isoform X2 [Nematostella vectensis]XP_048582824.1 uncharacterized protein LOC5508875 isoform X2 [Nematostella vectensis]XP_048582825.1 uncharacterized protein LOC5508875 isoform X2 [Nematostella vectensis]XP_048582826.1 uncharacterized protein LOC5508875 isoform X2 [Nematostella vectensis]